jgi:hypothetical protein
MQQPPKRDASSRLQKARLSVELLGCLVAGEDEALVLDGILVPELGSLAVERARAVRCQFPIPFSSPNLTEYSLVRLAQQTLQTQQHSANVVDRTPLVLQDIQADPAREVDVGVVDGCLEQHRGRRVWVVVGELHGQLEDQAGVRCIGRTVDSCGPERDVGIGWEGGNAGCGLHHDVHELLLESGCCQWRLVKRQEGRALSLKTVRVYVPLSDCCVAACHV